MLPRTQRLTTRQFATAFTGARPIRHALLQVRVYRREANVSRKMQGTRAAFVVPKKVGKAVVRNRLRRRVREIYRLHASREKLASRSLDLIFLLSPNALNASNDEMARALDDVLRRVLRA
jgi:ribonuclease P protein component